RGTERNDEALASRSRHCRLFPLAFDEEPVDERAARRPMAVARDTAAADDIDGVLEHDGSGVVACGRQLADASPRTSQRREPHHRAERLRLDLGLAAEDVQAAAIHGSSGRAACTDPGP